MRPPMTHRVKMPPFKSGHGATCLLHGSGTATKKNKPFRVNYPVSRHSNSIEKGPWKETKG